MMKLVGIFLTVLCLSTQAYAKEKSPARAVSSTAGNVQVKGAAAAALWAAMTDIAPGRCGGGYCRDGAGGHISCFDKDGEGKEYSCILNLSADGHFKELN
jgi:hypothetical protein